MPNAFRLTVLFVLLVVGVSRAAEPKSPLSSPPKGTLRLAADKTKGIFSGFKKSPAKSEDKAAADRPAAVKARETTAAVKTIRMDGHALMLGQEDQLALTTEQFRQQAAELLQTDQRLGLTPLVRRYPDIALQTLRDSLSSATPDKTLDAIASTFDNLWSNLPSNNGWSAALAAKTNAPQKYDAAIKARRELVAAMSDGRLPERRVALPSVLPKDAPTPWQVDAWHLTGIVALLEERPIDAAKAFQQAARLATTSQPFEAATSSLLWSEAARRNGDAKLAVSAWQFSVSQAASLLKRYPPIHDPAYWERAAYIRPNGANWPTELAPACKESLSHTHLADLESSVDATDITAALWACIGLARLDRDESQAALVAFKKAESLATTSLDRDRLQLAEAKTFVRLNQTAAAMALLARLSQHESSVIARPALALLGTMKLQANQATVGLSLLRKALESEPFTNWPGRGEAEADLGLAYLMTGDEPRGLKALHAAQQQFESTDQLELLLTALQNEAAYHTSRGNKPAAVNVNERLARLTPTK